MADPTAGDGGIPSANEDELLAASDAFLVELAQIEGLERRKRATSPTDPDRLSLAHEVEDRTLGLVGLSRYQTRLIEMDAEALSLGRSSPRAPGVILKEWRAAERELRDARSVMGRASDATDRLRDEHGNGPSPITARRAAADRRSWVGRRS